MRARILAAALGLAGAALLLCPSAAAHPVHVYCGPTGVNAYPGAYLAQLNPSDPATWTSSVADVSADPSGHCKACQESPAYDQVRSEVSRFFSPPYDDLVYHDLGYCSFFPL